MNTPEVKSAVQGFARFGYAAKGVVYLLIAALAVGAAAGSGRAGDSQEAMTSLSDKPFGKIVLGIIGIGLLAYALWRLYAGIANPEHDKTGKRLLYIGTGLINLALGFEAMRIVLTNSRGQTGNQAPHWTAELMSKPMGGMLVIIAGGVFAAYGIAQLVRAFRAKLDKHLRLGELDAKTIRVVRRLARLGIAARGVVFGVIGFFLIKAGLEHDPSQARDLGAALQEVQQQPFGKVMLFGIAIGLGLYGFYNLVRARYRSIHA